MGWRGNKGGKVGKNYNSIINKNTIKKEKKNLNDDAIEKYCSHPQMAGRVKRNTIWLA